MLGLCQALVSTLARITAPFSQGVVKARCYRLSPWQPSTNILADSKKDESRPFEADSNFIKLTVILYLVRSSFSCVYAVLGDHLHASRE